MLNPNASGWCLYHGTTLHTGLTDVWILQLKNVLIENHGLLSGFDIVPYHINKPLKLCWIQIQMGVLSQLEPNFAGMMFARSSKAKFSLCLFRKNHGYYREILVSEWLKLLESFPENTTPSEL